MILGEVDLRDVSAAKHRAEQEVGRRRRTVPVRVVSWAVRAWRRNHRMAHNAGSARSGGPNGSPVGADAGTRRVD